MKQRQSLGDLDNAVSTPFAPLLSPLHGTDSRIQYISLERAEALGLCATCRLPLTLKILLECALRHADDIGALDLSALANHPRRGNLEFHPTRLLLQDFTGTPLMTDLASLRDAVAKRGYDPRRVNPGIPIDFVCDHALIAVYGGRPDAMTLNEQIEIERNRERFEFLKWCAAAFSNIQLIPPGSGIMHQLNLEWLSTVVWLEETGGMKLARPDTLLGTDSHTPMVGGLGVLGWGVGGIEAQAAMLGHSTQVTMPRVVGLRLSGVRPKGVTATDLVLHIAELLRKSGVVNAFVEVFGDAVSTLSIETRATIANMAPEYGATSVYFPIDRESLKYLRLTGRADDQIARVEAYAKAQGLWEGPGPDIGVDIYDSVIDFDLSAVEPSLAGPKRPEQRTPLSKVPESFRKAFKGETSDKSSSTTALKPGDVVIAAITSCTNTANPSVMLGAGLMARNAVQRGLSVKPWVKTSLAPGSRVVGDYLATTGLQPHLDALGFQIIGYGCTTCNGNSGPLAEEIARQITVNDIAAVAVLSGNRNFAGRIHPLVPASYLASPALVIAFAIVGSVLIDLSREPLGIGADGKPVMLADIWPSDAEIASLLTFVSPDSYLSANRRAPLGHASWSEISAAEGAQFPWEPNSTFITPSPLDIPPAFEEGHDSIDNMRALAILGDGITTDTLSPNGAIMSRTPAAHFLTERGVRPGSFGNYAARRGCHEIAVRGMFANPHVENEMLPGKRGPLTLLMPEAEQTTMFDAGMAYVERGTPAIIIAGKAYGSGSSRDWAAKGLRHLGVRAVLAESFERIHRANLVGVGILPLTFASGSTRRTFGLTGLETFRLRGLRNGLSMGGRLALDIIRENGQTDTVDVDLSLETDNEIRILRSGGLLAVLLQGLTAAGN
jgi:aconitate hydratase